MRRLLGIAEAKLAVIGLLVALSAIPVLLRSAELPPADGESARFLFDGVELSTGAQPEAVIRILLEKESGEYAATLVIDYPLAGSVFPPEIVAPTFLWHDSDASVEQWLIEVDFAGGDESFHLLTSGALPEPDIDWECVTERNAEEPSAYPPSAKTWTPSPELWATVKRQSVDADATVVIRGVSGEIAAGRGRVVSRGSVTMRTSRDPVGAQIFYRDVPLMPTKTSEGLIQPLDKSMIPMIRWRLRDISRPEAPVVMRNLPTCANCHSFSADGRTLGMDMDGPAGDKGAYVVKEIEREMVIEPADVMTWNDFPGVPEDLNTFGLFSQVSPNGRYVVSMVNEEIFVANYAEILFVQTFYPTRGILVVHDRQTGKIEALPGADDPRYVHANATWSPDGKELVFLRAEAGPAYRGPERPTHANDERETPMRFDLYRIPFDEGRGGRATPIPGASDNGMSNSFPRFSPDGKWIVFVQAKNGMLLRPDSRLYIIPAVGGEARLMDCNTNRMNSWHSWSPNSRWLVFSSKVNRPFTQMFLTHIDENGNDTPPILVPHSTADNRAVNLPEFVRLAPGELQQITTPAVEYRRHLEQARLLKDDGRNDEAIVELERSLELKSDYWDTHFTLANILIRQGKARESIESFRRTVELNPRYFYAHANLGAALSQVGDYEAARRHLDVALEINPGSAESHSILGEILVRQSETDQAAIHFELALRIDPTLEHAHYHYGLLEARRGNLERAAAHLERVVAANPRSWIAYHELGRISARQGRFGEAIQRYRSSIAANSEYHPAYDSLARLLAAHADPSLRDGPAAVRLAETACRLTRFDHDSYLRTLAAAYAAAGRFGDAVRTAEKALELAQSRGHGGLAREIESDLALFRRGQALRI